MALQVKTEERNGTFVIAVAGEVDLYTSPDLRKAILEAVKRKSGIGVDLSGVPYMDSSGVATLVEGLQGASKKKAAFSLIAPSGAVMKVLQLARLDAVFDIRDTA